MLLSKMHYAIELSKLGHDVFFVNPPGENKTSNNKLACINAETHFQNFTVIDTKTIKGGLFFRNKLFFVYKRISAIYSNAIKQLVGKKIDEVWCFNPHLYVDLKFFKATKNILFIYDFYKGKYVFKTAQTADAIVSISGLILDYFSTVNKPKLLLQHGLGKYFSDLAYEKIKSQNLNSTESKPLKIGYMGNLMRGGMDLNITRKVIEDNTETEFNFWGPYSFEDNNVSDFTEEVQPELIQFIDFLKKQPNVILHGIKEQSVLAKAIFCMDAFLFLYSASKDLNAASNSHKILEYLSTGKVVISTYVSNYSDKNLLIMCEKDHEEQLPDLFKGVMNNLPAYNSIVNQKIRINYALDNTYPVQIERIHNFIY